MSGACSSGAKAFEWQLNFGGQWQKIENDHVLETHYRQPGAKAIAINTTSGKVFINFDTFRTDNPSVGVQRLSFLSAGQAEDYGWFFRGDRRWTEFGSQSPGGPASVGSGDLEQRFSANPAGRLSFSVGATGYSLDFSTMTQTNLTTGMRRQVRRRPRYPPAPGSSWDAPSPPRWQFQDVDGQWKDYVKGTCSVSSQEIELRYQQDPSGLLDFATKHFNYELDFAAMKQHNLSTNAWKAVRRLNP